MIKCFREYRYVQSEQHELKERGYAAISYIDHYSDGRVIEGTEDFTPERWKSQTVCRAVYVPTGEHDNGGHKRWEYFGSVYARTAADCGMIAHMVMDGREISIRKY